MKRIGGSFGSMDVLLQVCKGPTWHFCRSESRIWAVFLNRDLHSCAQLKAYDACIYIYILYYTYMYIYIYISYVLTGYFLKSAH